MNDYWSKPKILIDKLEKYLSTVSEETKRKAIAFAKKHPMLRVSSDGTIIKKDLNKKK